MPFETTIENLAQWLAATPLAMLLTDSAWLFGVIEAVHVMGLTLVLGSIALVDLHLLGLIERGRATHVVVRRLLPLTWTGFAVAATTGVVMIFANPQGYFGNFFFRGKLILLILAGVNVAVFHWIVQPRGGTLGQRLSGGISLVLWLSIVSFGRWIGFTIQ